MSFLGASCSPRQLRAYGKPITPSQMVPLNVGYSQKKKKPSAFSAEPPLGGGVPFSAWPQCYSKQVVVILFPLEVTGLGIVRWLGPPKHSSQQKQIQCQDGPFPVTLSCCVCTWFYPWALATSQTPPQFSDWIHKHLPYVLWPGMAHLELEGEGWPHSPVWPSTSWWVKGGKQRMTHLCSICKPVQAGSHGVSGFQSIAKDEKIPNMQALSSISSCLNCSCTIDQSQSRG